MKYDDEKCYQFHKEDLPDQCFACGRNAERLLIVRQIADMMLVHLCPDCMLDRVTIIFSTTRGPGPVKRRILLKRMSSSGLPPLRRDL